MRKNGWKRAGAILSCIFVLAGFPQQALAGSGGADGMNWQIDPDEEIALTLHCLCNGEPLEDIPFDLYYVGEVSADGALQMSEAFASCSVARMDLNRSDWRMMAETLDGYAQRDEAPVVMTGVTDANGILELPGESDVLSPGVYLCEAHQEIKDGSVYTIEPLLVSLPEQEENGTMIYDVNVYPKIQSREVKHEVDFTVIKIWKDSETAAGTTGSTAETDTEASAQAGRPKQIEVQLLKNGEVQEDQTVTLSAANNWQYTWTGLDDTAEWTAVEKEVPENYTVMTSLEDNDSRLVIINTEKTPETPSETPSTGPTQSETPQSETPQPETPQSETLKSETPQSESAQTEEITSGPMQSETSQSEGSQTEETQFETSEETTSTEGPVTKTSQGTTSSSSGTGTLPQTGMLLWPIPVLAIAGMVLFVIGWILHRKCW
jgi:hypothetical protein